MRKTVIRYGLLAGLILVVFWLLTKSFWMSPDGKMDMGKSELLGYSNMILSLSMVFFGVRHYRDKVLDGIITFRKAFWVGFLIALIASLVYMIGWMIYMSTSDFMQHFPAQYLEYMQQKWTTSGMTAEEITKKSSELQQNFEMYKNPIMLGLFSLFEILPVGIMVALISAFMLKKK